MTTLVIGVDGGTTKTIALAADLDGRILGAARGPGSNWTGEDVAQPMEVIGQTVRAALQQAGVAPADVALGMFTLAGADWPEDHIRRQAALEGHQIARQVVVKNDAFGGLRAGTRARCGVVIAAGTGANTAVIAPDGREYAFGYYQTYGGASDVSRDAIRAVLRAEDGRGRPTLLTAIVLDKLGCRTVDDVLRAQVALRVSRKALVETCPLVFEAAYAGDEVAAELIVRHGLALAEYATAAIRRFDMQQAEFDVVLAGGLFRGRGPLLVDTISQAIHRHAPRARVVRSRFEPAIGAVLLAFDALRQSVSDEAYERLAGTSPPHDFFSTANGSS